MKPCLLLPHGLYSLLISVLVTIGWLAALFEHGCNYAKLSGNLDAFLVSSDTPFIEIGLQAYRLPKVNVATVDEWDPDLAGACVAYSDEFAATMDAPWKMAKACSFLALVLGGGSTFYLWISTCCRFSRGSWRWAGYEVALAFVFQVLSFVWFHTELCRTNTCELFYGSKADIASAVLWLLAAVLIFCHYPIPKEVGDRDGIMNDSNGSRRSSTSSNGSGTSRRQQQQQKTNDSIGDLALTEMSSSSPTTAMSPKDAEPQQDQISDVEMAAGESPTERKSRRTNLSDVELT